MRRVFLGSEAVEQGALTAHELARQGCAVVSIRHDVNLAATYAGAHASSID